MDINQGYSILKAVMLENGRGFALGEHPTAPSPYVTWACYDDAHGKRQYEWGHYGNDRAALEADLTDRVQEYQRLYKVEIDHIEAPGLYRYYSTQRPVDIGTFPKPPHNAPDEIVNYDLRFRRGAILPTLSPCPISRCGIMSSGLPVTILIYRGVWRIRPRWWAGGRTWKSARNGSG